MWWWIAIPLFLLSLFVLFLVINQPGESDNSDPYEEYNAFVRSVNQIVKGMKKREEKINQKFFITKEDEEKMNELISSYNSLYAEIEDCLENARKFLPQTPWAADSVLEWGRTLLGKMERKIREIDNIIIRMSDTKVTQPKKNAIVSWTFFGDCNDLISLKKKYRKLAKQYHPDAQDGDAETFKKMKAEYEEKKAFFKNKFVN